MSTTSSSSPSLTARLGGARKVLLGLVTLATVGLLLTGCGDRQSTGPAEEDGFGYRFITSGSYLVRVSTTDGQVSIAKTTSGMDKIWTPLGDAPAPDAHPRTADRFLARTLPIRTGRGAQIEIAKLLRVDRATGRTWIIAVQPGYQWLEVASPEGGAERPSAPVKPAGTPPKPTMPPQMELPPVPTEKIDTSVEKAAVDISTYTKALEQEGLPLSMKVFAAGQLGRYDPELSGPPLRKALQSSEPEVIVAAIQALENAGDVAATPAILKLKDHPDPRVRAAVEAAIVDDR